MLQLQFWVVYNNKLLYWNTVKSSKGIMIHNQNEGFPILHSADSKIF